MLFINHYFTNSTINKNLFEKYSQNKYFGTASEILKNPTMREIGELFDAQKKMAGILSQKVSYLLVNFLLDTEEGDIYIWNSLFSDHKSAFIDIMSYEPEVTITGLIKDDGFIAGSSFLNAEKSMLRISDVIKSSRFRDGILNLSFSAIEDFIYNFLIFEEYYEDVKSLAEKIINEWFLDGRIVKYVEENYNKHLMEDFLKTYSPEKHEELIYLWG